MVTVLVAEDEPDVREILRTCCEQLGHRVVGACDGTEALRLFYEHHPDLVITDIRMPAMDGFTLTQRIREIAEVPIIVLSALGGEEEKVQGLQLGADEYLVKPIGIKELQARIETALRRTVRVANGAQTVYSDRALSIDFQRQEVTVRGQKVNVTGKEFKLLAYLTRQAPRVAPVPELLQNVWGSEHYSEDSVKWHIASLRRKVEEDPRQPKLIITVWGSGYRYEKPATGPERMTA